MWARLAVVALLVVAVCGQVFPRTVDSRCDGARMIASMGYHHHLNNCYQFIQCEYDDDGKATKAQVMSCPCGEFWDDEHLTCAASGDVNCGGGTDDSRTEPCGTAPITAGHGRTDNCRTYYACDGTRTGRGACCDSGYRWDNAGGNNNDGDCVLDGACQDPCLCDEITTTGKPVCDLTEIPNDRFAYYQYEHGVRRRMRCAPGSAFNITKCGCGDHVQIPRDACPLDFDMQCNQAPLVDQQNYVWIENQDVTVNLNNNQCEFGGSNSILTVPRYANMDWQNKFAIRVEFTANANQGVNDNKPLFSNDLCAPLSMQRSISLHLRYRAPVPGNTPPILQRYYVEGVVVLRPTALAAQTTVSVQATYTPGQLQLARLSYDGSTIILCVSANNAPAGSGNSDSKAATGLVRKNHCSVEFGHDKAGYYSGDISRVAVHVFCVPADFNEAC